MCWLEIWIKLFFVICLLGMELLYYNKRMVLEEFEFVSFLKFLWIWRVLLMWIFVKNLEDKNLGFYVSYIFKLVVIIIIIIRNVLWVFR